MGMFGRSANMKDDAIARQQEYYSDTASKYDEMHSQDLEHEVALAQLFGYLRHFAFSSLLDVGAGTGRVIRQARRHQLSTKVMGVEPVSRLREIAHRNGVDETEIMDGDATSLPFPDDRFDVVCAFGILHHIPNPNLAVREMCRVARHAVFLSDLNSFGCGSTSQKLISQSIHLLGLWKMFQWIKNGGRLDKYSPGDGVHYSYSLFDSLGVVREKFPQVFLGNTRGSSNSLYRGCSHISVFAIKSMDQIASGKRQ
jgi:ubiquinone/menaquinone biosynthesis C-methylase UbiE